ncbi:MAG: helix-turn-helix domain-containing protein [Bacilli bacterium]
MVIIANKKRFIQIPFDLISDSNLNPIDLIIYGQILSLTNQTGYCYANNKYFMKQNRLSMSAITRSLSRLKKNGYIQMNYQCNETNSKKRTIYLIEGIVKYD